MSAQVSVWRRNASCFVALTVFALGLCTTAPVMAASLQVGGWIPWWSEESGVESVLENMDEFDVLYPFVFEVQAGGVLKNRVDFDSRHWKKMFKEAGDERVDVLPSVAWFDGDEIHTVLSDQTLREKHIKEIVQMVRQGNFAGVNIDYESKNAETINYFSDFLEELKDELGRELSLSCTVEARMPPESRWRKVPKNIQYANDYKAMNKHCDWVEIMAYDQQRADLKLNSERRGVPYMPVADIDWVKKVLDFALEDFDKRNVVLGVATYGRAWDVTVASDWYKDYSSVATLNEPKILELAERYTVPVGRTEGGEAVITYFPDDSPWQVLDKLPVPKGTPRGYEAAAKALLVATYANIEIPVRMIVWSDAEAIADKISLASKQKIRGVAIFKIDGEESGKMWRKL